MHENRNFIVPVKILTPFACALFSMARHLLQNYSLQWVIAILKTNSVVYRTDSVFFHNRVGFFTKSTWFLFKHQLNCFTELTLFFLQSLLNYFTKLA